MRRIELLDYYKGIAILAIVTMHLIQDFMAKDGAIPHSLNLLSSYGGAGGHVFILCSGFGLFLSQIYKNRSFKDFIRRRFKQVYMPYILVIVVSFMIPYINGGKDRLIGLLSHIFLFKMFFAEYISTFGTQMWFISTIIQLYLVFIPLNAMVRYLLDRNMRRKNILLIFLVVSWIWMTIIFIIGKSDLRSWSGFFLSYLWEFVAGMLLADYYIAHKKMYVERFSNLKLFMSFLICFIGYAVLSLQNNILKQYNDIFSLASFIVLITLIYRLSTRSIGKIGAWLGKLSYEWYLLHMMVFIIIFHYYSSNLASIYLIPIMAFITSIIISYLYKQVLMMLKQKFSCFF